MDIATVLSGGSGLKRFLATATSTAPTMQTNSLFIPTTANPFSTSSSECVAPKLPVVAKGAIAGLAAVAGVLCAAVVVLVFLWRKAVGRGKSFEDLLPKLQHPTGTQTSATRAQELDTGTPLTGKMTSELDATPMECMVSETFMKGVAEAPDK